MHLRLIKMYFLVTFSLLAVCKSNLYVSPSPPSISSWTVKPSSSALSETLRLLFLLVISSSPLFKSAIFRHVGVRRAQAPKRIRIVRHWIWWSARCGTSWPCFVEIQNAQNFASEMAEDCKVYAYSYMAHSILLGYFSNCNETELWSTDHEHFDF